MRNVTKMTDKGHPRRVYKYFSWLVILVSICPFCQSEITVITEGRRFMLAFPDNFPKYCDFLMVLTASVTADSPDDYILVRIKISSLDIIFYQTLTIGTPTTVDVRNIVESAGAGRNTGENSVVYVEAEAGKISVVGRIKCRSSPKPPKKQRVLGEYLAIPVEYWGTRYVVMAPFDLSCGYSTTVLTNNLKNSITIDLVIRTLRIDGYVNINGVLYIQEGVWDITLGTRTEIVAVNVDITGSIIESVYPIGVLIGPNNDASLSNALCQFKQSLFVEQLIPTYAWGTSYYINDGGAGPSLLYNYDMIVVASQDDTDVRYSYIGTFQNKTRFFKNNHTLLLAGSSFRLPLKDLVVFDIVMADRPIMVLIYTSSSASGMDGALMQAVMADSWPSSVVLKLGPNLGQRIHVIVDTFCSAALTFLSDVSIIEVYDSLDTGRQELEVYIIAGLVRADSQIIVSVNTDAQGCGGVSAFSMHDDGNYVLGACPNFWSVECPDGTYFDIDEKLCIPIQTTATETSTGVHATIAADTGATNLEGTASVAPPLTDEPTSQASSDALVDTPVWSPFLESTESASVTGFTDCTLTGTTGTSDCVELADELGLYGVSEMSSTTMADVSDGGSSSLIPELSDVSAGWATVTYEVFDDGVLTAETSLEPSTTPETSWEPPTTSETSWEPPTTSETSWEPPTTPETSWEPPTTPETSWGPPTTPETSWGPSTTPETSWEPPTTSETSWEPPTTSETSWEPPTTPETSWEPPTTPETSWGPPTTPETSWGPPTTPETSWEPPTTPETSWEPPTTPETSWEPPTTSETSWLPSTTPNTPLVSSATSNTSLVSSATSNTSLVSSATSNTSLVSSATPNAPLVSSTTPNTSLVSSATPNTPLVSSATPNAPLVSSATPNAPFVSSATPNTPLVSSTTLNTSLVSSTTPNTSLVSSTTPNTSLVSLATPNTSLVSSATPNTSLVSSTTPETSNRQSSDSTSLPKATNISQPTTNVFSATLRDTTTHNVEKELLLHRKNGSVPSPVNPNNETIGDGTTEPFDPPKIDQELPTDLRPLVTTNPPLSRIVTSGGDKQPTKECACFCQVRSHASSLHNQHEVYGLKVNTAILSSTRRLHTSAEDPRPRTVGIGVIAILSVMCSTLLLLALPSAINMSNRSKRTNEQKDTANRLPLEEPQ